ncbi:MAG: C39 family peptidase [Deltaproteobacteria bacterium]|nr:C39 family peptidase [Deltaproteobacteria bacterium]MBI3387744.1 C39 family peptidase [Deltaproteobacteria bacterium]
MTRRITGVTALLVVFATAACVAHRAPPSASAHLIAGVPFFPQDPHQCGPAALAALVSFVGQPTGPEAIAHEIYQPTIEGTSTAAMLAYGARHHLPIEARCGTLADLHREIDAGRPIVALLSQGMLIRSYHFVVVTGYDPAGGALYGYSGRDADAQWTAEDFLKRWDRADNWALVWVGGEHAVARPAPYHGTGEQHQTGADEGK